MIDDLDAQLRPVVEAEGLEPFLRWWLAQPLFATLPPEAVQIESRLEGRPDGLASSLRRAGTGAQEPLWADLAGLHMPVLVIAGGLDTKYVDLAERIGRSIGDNATVRVIDGAGHACHLERPDEFVRLIAEWD